MVGFRTIRIAALAIAASAFATHVTAQEMGIGWQLLNRIVEASNSISTDTAREGYDLCVEIGRELDAIEEMDLVERLYLESEVESCIAYAMNNGQFSDENGDSCDHHFLFATRLTESILAAQGKPGVQPEQFEETRNRLQRAIELGPDMGCTGDYAGLIGTLPAQDAIAVAAGIPNEGIERRFATLKGGITRETADETIVACRALGDEVQQNLALNAVEITYFEAVTEDCIAGAMVHGGKPNDVGDACAHHHLYAMHLSVTLMVDREMKFLAESALNRINYAFETALRQGPEMGCTEDYSGLRIE